MDKKGDLQTNAKEVWSKSKPRAFWQDAMDFVQGTAKI
jgi:hypothetical protein